MSGKVADSHPHMDYAIHLVSQTRVQLVGEYPVCAITEVHPPTSSLEFPVNLNFFFPFQISYIQPNY